MKIRIANKGHRNQLICEKKDGAFEIADLGPTLPFHDIAHFIVERHLKLQNGFFGNIYNGYSVKQLSDKEVIKTLSAESTVAEITTRALQALASGACTAEQFTGLVKEEFEIYSVDFSLDLDENKINKMLSDFKSILFQWEQLREGEALELEFEATSPRPSP